MYLNDSDRRKTDGKSDRREPDIESYISVVEIALQAQSDASDRRKSRLKDELVRAKTALQSKTKP